jgi:HlyD family secretion protein
MADRKEVGVGRFWWRCAAVSVVTAACVGLVAIRGGSGSPAALAASSTDVQASGSVGSDGKTSPGAASKVAPDSVRALARLEPESGVVSVGVRPGQRITRIMVKEGESVGTDKVLAVLEGRQAAEEQLAIAEATKKAADWKRGLRKRALEVERAATDETRKLQLESAKRSADLTKTKFETSSKMFKTFGSGLKGKELYDAEGALFQLEVGQIRTELDRAVLEVAMGTEANKKKRAIEDEELSDKSPANDVLDRQIALAKVAVNETDVRPPRAGKVLRLLAHEGEVSSGAVLELGDVATMVAVAEVYETDAVGIKVGDGAEVNIFGRKVSGKVSKVGSIVGRNQMMSVDPRALRDMRVVLVTIVLADGELASRFVNMEVETTIRPSEVGIRPAASPGDISSE